jgi:tRNA modification GTPase
VFSVEDTVVAIATPPGRGGIGVVRLSGPQAEAIAKRLITHREPLEPRRATFTKIVGRDGRAAAEHGGVVDHAIVTFFPSPHSYTGEDVAEISAHGSPVVLREIVNAAIGCGARLAEPGEFTLRAFLNGRIDLTQAEAVADLIDAATPLQARAAFDQLEGTLTGAIASIDATLFDLIARLEASVDFPDEGYHFVEPGALANAIDVVRQQTARLLEDGARGRLIREGLQVAIVGRPNVGKSSLFNALVGSARAIVTDVPGTTRDLITEVVDLDGLRVTLVDTAGLRDADNAIEAEGVERSMQSVRVADLVVQVIVDDEPQHVANKQLIVHNKADLRPASASRLGAIAASATTGAGLDDVRRGIVATLAAEESGDRVRDRPDITNVRHIALVQRAHDALGRARSAATAEGGALSEEFVLADLQEARAALEEITGRRAPEDVLAHIFERFCVGK